MSVRNMRKLGVAALAGSAIALSTFASATADTPGYFQAGSYNNTTTAMVGVGSDTIQWVTDDLSKAYDDSLTSGGTAANPSWISVSACQGFGTGPNPDGTGFPCSNGTATAGLKRDDSVVDSTVDPTKGNGALANGSGSARTLLTNPNDPLFNDIAYARSSGPAGSTDIANGEIAMPFALDTISIAVSPDGPAPASLTGDQVYDIFTGAVTNWAQVGGKNAPIHAYIPKTGSSTRGAFLSFMSNLGGTPTAPGDHADPAVESWASATWAGKKLSGAELTDPSNLDWKAGTTSVEEHDPTLIENDVDAIEPFSLGRAEMANGGVGSAKQYDNLVRITGGWSADRALYDVVRGKAVSGATTTPWLWGADNGALEKIFGTAGWVCKSDDATSLIAKDGFWKLQPSQCGVANPNPVDPAGLVGLGKAPYTTTKATPAADGKSVSVKVTAANGSTPAGTVQVSLWSPTATTGYTATGTLAGGTVTVAVPTNVPAGTWNVGASYVPADQAAFNPSSTTASAADGTGLTHDGTITVGRATTGGGTTVTKPPATHTAPAVNTKLVKAQHKLTKDEKALKKAKKQAKKAHGAKKAKLQKKIKKLKKAVKADKSAVKAAK